jgi:hypothetical protein
VALRQREYMEREEKEWRNYERNYEFDGVIGCVESLTGVAGRIPAAIYWRLHNSLMLIVNMLDSLLLP